MFLSPTRSNVRFVAITLLIIAIVSLASWSLPRITEAAKTEALPNPAFVEEHFIRKINLLANDITVDPITQTIYVSTPSTALQNGNSIVPLNPSIGVAGDPAFIGSEPGQMAISDNGQSMFVVLN